MPGGQTYSFSRYSLVLGTKRLTGFAADTGIEWEPDDDTFISEIGVDGEKSRSHTNVTSGFFTVFLKQTAADNQFLSNLLNTDSATLQAQVSIALIDANGTTVISSDKGWVARWASVTLAKEGSAREWRIEHAQGTINIGGNL